MRTSDSIVNIASALAKMQPELGAIAKSGENTFDKYTYATLDDYIKGTREVLSKYGFFMTASVEKLDQLADRPTRNGGLEHAVQISLTARLIHQSGEWIEISCIGEGQDRADKAIYKAITGARKYAIASILGLATSDDPEADEQVGETSAAKFTSSAPVKPQAKPQVKPVPANDQYAKMLQSFASLGYTERQVLDYAEAKTRAELDNDKMAALKGAYSALMGGTLTKQDFLKKGEQK